MSRKSLLLKLPLNMADDEDLISTDHQFLIEYYWEDLVKRINITSSSLIDILMGNEVLTQQEGEDLKVFYELIKLIITEVLHQHVFYLHSYLIPDKRKICETTGCRKK